MSSFRPKVDIECGLSGADWPTGRRTAVIWLEARQRSMHGHSNCPWTATMGSAPIF